ncbi:MAG: hypothetical protein Q9180_004477 [Flavoplaca navasiana]
MLPQPWIPSDLSLKELATAQQHSDFATVNQPKLEVQDGVTALASQILHRHVEEQGKDLVLYLHSYTGFSRSTPIKGLSKTERLAAGKRGGILGLINLLLSLSRQTLLQMIGGNYTSCTKQAFVKPFIGIPIYDDRGVYLLTSQDEALPAFAQEAFVRGSGVEWNVHQLDTSQSPFLREPEQLAAIVEVKVKDYVANSIYQDVTKSGQRAETLQLTSWGNRYFDGRSNRWKPSAGNRYENLPPTPHASSAKLAGSGRSASSTRVAGAGLAVGAGHRSARSTKRS